MATFGSPFGSPFGGDTSTLLAADAIANVLPANTVLAADATVNVLPAPTGGEITLGVPALALTVKMGAVTLSTYTLQEVALEVQPLTLTLSMAAGLHTNNDMVIFTVSARVRKFQSRARVRTFQSRAEVRN